MKVKQMKELLSQLSDDADVVIWVPEDYYDTDEGWQAVEFTWETIDDVALMIYAPNVVME